MKKSLCILIIMMIAVCCVACSGDGGKETTPPNNDPAHEHEFSEWYSIRESTCTEEGDDERSCECGEKQQKKAKLADHTYDASTEITAPTYSDEGYTTYFCVCGESRTGDPTAALKDDTAAIPLSEMYAVLPDSTENEIVYAKDKLLLGLQSLVGVQLPNGSETGNTYEILLGNTGRPESAALVAELSEGEFAIRVTGNKLIIAAKEDIFLFEAVEYLLDTYLDPQINTDGEKPLLISSSINVIRKGNVHSLYYTMMNGESDLFFDSVTSHSLKNDKYYKPGQTYETHIYRRQGGCFNGSNMYQVFLSANEELSVIAKKDIVTGAITYSEPRVMNHANDITYNPITNRVYVCDSSKVHVFDADTLEYIETIASAVSGSGIDFSAERNLFLFKSGMSFSTASADLGTELGRVFTSNLTGYTSQGICADDTLIYFLLCQSIGNSKYQTYLAIYDWYGNFVRFMTIKITDNYEPENISVVDGQIYIGACSPQPVVTLYRVDLESVSTSDTNSGNKENTEVTFDYTAETKKAYTLSNDYASEDSDPRIHRRRGGYFDGENFYQAYISANGDLGIIAKKNVRTGEVIYSEPVSLGQAKDITYDPATDCIIVSARSNKLYVFKADTLEFVKEITVSVTVNAIDYNEKTGEYICLNDDELSVLDSSFRVKSTVTIEKPIGYTSHAMAVDENGVIYVLYLKSAGSEKYTCCVAVYESGSTAPVELISFDLPDNCEPANISIVNGNIYVAGCTPQPEVTLYKLNKQ